MRKGKGRISNHLVAASCTAVLSVFAAGYWRTRDAARQFDMQAKGRRPAARTQAQRTAATGPPQAVIEASSPAPQPSTAPTTIASTAQSAARSPLPLLALKAARSSPISAPGVTHASTAPAPEATSAPASAEHGIVVEPVTVTEPIPAAPPVPGPAATPAARWRDGIYTGHGDSPHGDLDVRVVIRDGRIVEAAVGTCNTRYPCELLDPMVKQALVIQSSNVDYVSRATESSQAYNDGLVEALDKALYPSAGKDSASQ
jgi:uncharacterized protein with FMN-binding domain